MFYSATGVVKHNSTLALHCFTQALQSSNNCRLSIIDTFITAARQREQQTGNIMTVYQVTAVWDDCEIGYGEGETLNYAKQECLDSIESIYSSLDKSEIKFIIISN